MSKTLHVINDAHERRQGKGFREHLGASVIGKPCARELWYIFRWARRSKFKARILRLFDRGNREEPALVSLLRKAGIHVLDVNPETGKQFRMEDHNGHFGGSMDAKVFDCPDFPGIWVLGEFKTHGDKSFKKLRKEGIAKSKPEHVVQANLYMHYEDLPACLHININKNDDDIELVLLERDDAVAEKYADRAGRIIKAIAPPPRINESPGWYQCKFCDFSPVCHEHRPKEMNCRTCIHADPVENAQWRCDKYNCILSKADQLQGCQQHVEIPED